MTFIEDILSYSASIGKDSMLIQGAGGNISWKDNNTLWIKASGTHLANAEAQDIFIPLILSQARDTIQLGSLDFTEAFVRTSSLRPSIETAMHAILPQSIVVHLHAVDIIAGAVLKNGKKYFSDRLADMNWAWLDYVKPGLELANKITQYIKNHSIPDIIILGNHGLVIAGDTLEEVKDLLQKVLTRCYIEPRHLPSLDLNKLDALKDECNVDYGLPENSHLHALATDPICLTLSKDCWVMYPDHAIFLGDRALFYNKGVKECDLIQSVPCIIIEDEGILVNRKLSDSQKAMLDCYLNVMLRITDPQDVKALTGFEVADLLNWEAEKYRQGLDEKNNITRLT